MYKNRVFRLLFVYNEEIKMSCSNNSKRESNIEEYYNEYIIIQQIINKELIRLNISVIH